MRQASRRRRKQTGRQVKEKNERIYEAGYEDGYHDAASSFVAMSAQPTRNDTAFIIGLIAGLFGIWGLAHILNDKLGMGCLWFFIVGPLVAGLLAGLIVMTAGLGTIVALPLWLYIVYSQAKNGATRP